MRSDRPDRGSSRRRVAVVGSGVSGLTAGYVLQREYDVTLYETDDRLGGHAHTHDVVTPDSGAVPVDTGFIVHNARTYPHLLRLFGELGVATQPTEMSMSIHCDGCGLEYAGAKGLSGLFAQPRSLARPAYLRMLARGEAVPPARPPRPRQPATTRSRWAASWPTAGTRRTSCSTSWCRSCPASGRPRRTTRWTTRPATCSRSSTTTGCSR